MMTEKEARTKWCPIERAALGNNRFKTDAKNDGGHAIGAADACLCIASACMMWRREWGSEKGYCGLAGKPIPTP